MTWVDASSNEQGFRVFREVASGPDVSVSAFEAIGTIGPDIERFVDESVLPGVFYSYAVAAFNEAGSSTPTQQTNAPVQRGPLLIALTVQRAGTGAGSVTSVPTGIVCGDDCYETFESGTSVMLSASPAVGSQFEGWSGACSGVASICTVVASSDAQVVATFAPFIQQPDTAVVNVVKVGGGTGLVTSSPVGIYCGEDCSGIYEVGEAVTLSATPAPGSSFAGWTGSGCSGYGDCVVTATGTHSVTAEFWRVWHSVSVSVTGEGRVTSSPPRIQCGTDCTAQFEALTPVTLTATPDPGTEFLGWGGACSGTSTTCSLAMTSPASVTAQFGNHRIVVTTTSSSVGTEQCSLRDAIRAANTDAPSGGCRAGNGHDTIQLPAYATINLFEVDNNATGANGLPSVTTPITIQGNHSTITRGSAAPEFRLFRIGPSGNLTLESLTLSNGHGGTIGGGAMLVESGTATLIDTTVTLNRAHVGVASLGGGVLNLGGDLTVESSLFSDNRLFDDDWGTIYESSGGAIAVIDGNVVVRDSGLIGNRAGVVGGVHSAGTGSTVTIERTVIANNVGIAFSNAGTIHLRDVELRSNGQDYHAGLTNHGSAYLERVTFEGHEPMFEAPFLNAGYLELKNSIVRNNFASLHGSSGVISNSGSMDIINSQIVHNQGTQNAGGGIGNTGSMTIRGSTLSHQWANYGGAIVNYGELDIIDSLLTRNAGMNGGGAIANIGSLRLLGTTSVGVSGEGNTTIRDGGGIAAESGSYTYICPTCSVTGNRSSDGIGAGVYVAGGATLDVPDPSRVYGNSPDQIGYEP